MVIMAKKEEAKTSDFDFDTSLDMVDDWDWKKVAFERYVHNVGIEIKSEKEFTKQYEEFWRK